MFHERVVYETERRRPESDESSPSATYMRLVIEDVIEFTWRVNAVPRAWLPSCQALIVLREKIEAWNREGDLVE